MNYGRFTGFSEKALDFLRGIQVNNYEQYYQDHKEEYETLIRLPMYALCTELAPVIRTIDDKLDTRPVSAVARLRRDTRFTKDKSPFRDHTWMGWRYPGERRSEGFHIYWGFGTDWIEIGCGSYTTDKKRMDALREVILNTGSEGEKVFSEPALNRDFRISGELYKKMKVPETVPESLRLLYRMKYFGFSSVDAHKQWEAFTSSKLISVISGGLLTLAPVIQLMNRIMADTVLREEDEKEAVEQWQSGILKGTVRQPDEFEF